MMKDKVLIIAEAGVNHNGDVEIAKKLIDVAKDAEADIVKFQTSKVSSLVSRIAKKAEYQIKNTGKEDESQFKMLEKISLKFKDFDVLKDYAEKKGIQFLSTPFDIESIDYLKSLGCSLWKIPSGEITNYPYLAHIAAFGDRIIMSTGMATMDEVREAVGLLKEKGAGEITLLHCTTEYPTLFEDVNLRAMLELRKEFGCKVGYSDHTLGINLPIAAVAMGACVIEKHFTLSREMEGPDHVASLEPSELKSMVEGIRNIEKALGSGKKAPAESEKKNMEIARKSIVAKTDIKKGDLLDESNITAKRPGNGISPMKWNMIIGTKAVRDFIADELITLSE